MQPDENAWRGGAACRGTDLHLWFPAPSAPSKSALEKQRVRDAKAVCRDCPVKTACLDYAFDHHIWHGMWGGMTERERRALVRLNRRARARAREKEDQTA